METGTREDTKKKSTGSAPCRQDRIAGSLAPSSAPPKR
jgi:hypothetical protein